MSNKSTASNKSTEIKPLDVLIILDASGSMECMGEEPIQSINSFIEKQKETSIGTETFTLINFSDTITTLIDNKNLLSMEPIEQSIYKCNGFTSLNDAICLTIKNALESEKPNNKILVIITDGQENSSKIYTSTDVKKDINKVEQEHDWKVIFLGANINVLEEATNLNINASRCCEFNQNQYGNLLQLCRNASDSVNTYRRALSEGNQNSELVLSENVSENISENVFTEIMTPDLPLPTRTRNLYY